MAGTLYVVATPIGNLADLSTRAADVLRSVGLVAAEDTRETRKLLAYVGSRAKSLSLHSHSPASRQEKVVGLLGAGTDVALVTDAGTPGVSDPGAELVAAARREGHPIVPIPGPSAVHTALSAAGLPADRYLFLGFPPRGGKDRETWLGRIRDSEFTVVCFEAPGRASGLLADVARVCGGDRAVVVGREMTKRFEEFLAGATSDLASELAERELKGEVTIVIAGGRGSESRPAAPAMGPVRDMARALLQAGIERSRVARALAEVYGLSRNESYRLSMEGS